MVRPSSLGLWYPAAWARANWSADSERNCRPLVTVMNSGMKHLTTYPRRALWEEAFIVAGGSGRFRNPRFGAGKACGKATGWSRGLANDRFARRRSLQLGNFFQRSIVAGDEEGVGIFQHIVWIGRRIHRIGQDIMQRDDGNVMFLS